MQIMVAKMEIRRIHKQHNSKIVTMPKLVLQAMGAKEGDYIMFKQIEQTGAFVLAKVVEGDYHSAKHKSNIDSQDQGGGTRPKVRR